MGEILLVPRGVLALSPVRGCSGCSDISIQGHSCNVFHKLVKCEKKNINRK